MLEMSAQTGCVAWGLYRGKAAACEAGRVVQPGRRARSEDGPARDTVVCTARASASGDGLVDVEVRFSGSPHDGESVFRGACMSRYAKGSS